MFAFRVFLMYCSWVTSSAQFELTEISDISSSTIMARFAAELLFFREGLEVIPSGGGGGFLSVLPVKNRSYSPGPNTRQRTAARGRSVTIHSPRRKIGESISLLKTTSFQRIQQSRRMARMMDEVIAGQVCREKTPPSPPGHGRERTAVRIRMKKSFVQSNPETSFSPV